jgi:hypothetical protein
MSKPSSDLELNSSETTFKELDLAQNPRLSLPGSKKDQDSEIRQYHLAKKSARATTKLRLLEKEGSLQLDIHRRQKWEDQIRLLDQHAGISCNSKLRWTVRHSRCAKHIKVKEPYDVTRFRDHVNNTCPFRPLANQATSQQLQVASQSNSVESLDGTEQPPTKKPCVRSSQRKHPAAGTAPITAFFSSSSKSQTGGTSKSSSHGPLQSKAPAKLWPCPGLRKSNDKRIAQFFNRYSLIAGGGGRSLTVISKELFNTAFCDLSPSQKKRVYDQNCIEWQWRYDYEGQRVFAVKCANTVPNNQKPCARCERLLCNRRFTAILRRRVKSTKHISSVPKRFRSSALGKLFSRYIGLKEIVANAINASVCFNFYLILMQFNIYLVFHISGRNIVIQPLFMLRVLYLESIQTTPLLALLRH